MAGIPEEIIERVKAEANIVDVVSDYVRLRRSGKNWTGLCPFHDDKKPSFAVEPVKGIYRCFSCGKGGNVYTFLMEINGWTFPESVRNLAEGLGIEIPEDAKETEKYSENERLASAVRDAAEFYYRTLRSKAGVAAQAYFKTRGFTDETIKAFGLGYAPDEWEALMNHLTAKGYTAPELERAGLLIKREGRSGWYDRFRGRTMFPIFTATGRIAGFGARRMSEDPDQPKYINSPETAIYQKSRLLYGLFQAKDSIRKGGLALFVEGYADVISLHQAGVTTAIATSGTAMAREHAELIARYCSRVVLIFDSDKAGQSATERGIDVLLRQGLDVSVLRLPDGEDPDTFIRKYGAKEFDRRVLESVSFLEFRARALKDAGDFDSPNRATEAIRSIVTTISLIPDQLKRELYLQKLAADYHLPEGVMVQELQRALGRGVKASGWRREDAPKKTEAPVVPDAAPSTETPPGNEATAEAEAREDRGDGPEPGNVETAIERVEVRKAVTASEFPFAELILMRVLMQGDPQMLEHVSARIVPEDFAHPLMRRLLGVILAHYVNQRSFSLEDLVIEELDPELRDLVTLLSVDRESISIHWARLDPDLTEPNQWKIARDCLIRIEQEKILRESLAVYDALRQPDLPEDRERELLSRIKEIGQRKEELVVLLGGV